LDTHYFLIGTANINVVIEVKITEYIETKNDNAIELKIIKVYLAEVKAILDDTDVSAEKAFKKLENYSKKLGKRPESKKCMETER